MLLPSTRFDLPFTCVDSSGLPTSPTGTPAATLVWNGIDQNTSVTVTMNGAQGVASCTIPSDAVAGDRFSIRISAIISAITYVVAGPSEAVESPHTLTAAYDPAKSSAPTAAVNATAIRTELATELARIDATVSSRLAASNYSASGNAPSAADIATQVRTELSTELARVDSTISSRLAAVDYSSPPSVAGLATSDSISHLANAVNALPDATQIAAEILVDPTHRLLTSDQGHVTATNGGEGGSSGGNTSTFVMPLRSTSWERVEANRIDLFVRERVPLTISIFDAQKQAVECAGLVCTLFIEGGIEIPDLTPTSATTGGVSNRYSFTPPESMTATPATRWFSLRISDTTERVMAFGHIVVAQVP